MQFIHSVGPISSGLLQKAETKVGMDLGQLTYLGLHGDWEYRLLQRGFLQ